MMAPRVHLVEENALSLELVTAIRNRRTRTSSGEAAPPPPWP